jgi:hypothetical protein
MSERLTRLPVPPPADAMVYVPEGESLHVAVAPPVEYFRREADYWQGEFARADRAGDAVARRSAESYRFIFNEICVTGRITLATMIVGRQPYDPAFAGTWHAISAASMSHSRLVRTDALGLFAKTKVGFGFKADTTKIGVDLDEVEPAKSGVHIHNSILEELHLEPVPLGGEIWYEGEQVFIRARARAQPSQNFVQEWWQFYGAENPFRRRDFTSFVPRLKRELWDAGT